MTEPCQQGKNMAETSSPSLLLAMPEELLVQVLLKLPVESLIVSRKVCKLFNTYISSESFSRSHVQLWVNRDTMMKHVFLSQNFAPNDHDLDSRGKKLCLEFAKSTLDFRQPRNCRFLFQENETKLQFGGCYDGILCFYEFRGVSDDAKKVWDLVIYICNPALNQCKVISRQRELLYSKRTTKVCFVRDPTSGDYKIIVVSVCDEGRGPEVYVYRLNECCWRTISAGTRPSYCVKDEKYSRLSDLVVHNTSVYWLINYVDRYDDNYNVLNALDLHQESVREIVLADYLRYQGTNSYFMLLRYQGSLAICCGYLYDLMSYEKLCLMVEEENGRISWGNRIKFDYRVSCKSCGEEVGSERCGCFHRFICKMPMATSSVGCLMFCEQENTYHLSNAESKEPLGKFRIPFRPGNACITAADYVPSFVSIMPKQL